MKKKKAARPSRSRAIELPARLTIAASLELHRTLAKALASGTPLCVDGSQVEEIDTSILQLLASAWTDAAQRRIVCKWQGSSAVLRNAAKLIGVAEVLQFDRAA